MFATSISRRAWASALASWATIWLLAAGALAQETNQTSRPNPATNSFARAIAAFHDLRATYLSNTNNATNAWQFARACFDLAELATNNSYKADIAEQGIAASRRTVALDPKSAHGHYYLGMTIGQLADTKRNLAALKMVKEMEREFNTAAELDEHLDFAGPDRNLGLLYHQAPSVISIGSRIKARQHLERAVKLAPDYPENRLNLIEALIRWGDSEAARREFTALEKTWPDAKKKFSDAIWAATRADWEKRSAIIKRKLDETK